MMIEARVVYDGRDSEPGNTMFDGDILFARNRASALGVAVAFSTGAPTRTASDEDRFDPSMFA